MDSFLIAEYIGIASATLSGFLFGIRHKCDWLGVFIASILTALGGGILRDIIVGRPLYSFTHFMPVSIVLAMFSLAIVLKLYKTKRHHIDEKFIFIFTDAIDMVSFSLVGAMVAISFNLNIFGVVLVAFSNGVGGGILRDILLNEVPWFLKTGLYGTISLLVGLAYYLVFLAGFDGVVMTFVLLGLGVIFRMSAYYKGWRLPQINYEN